ncbi:proprotein convertase P-domain-containing protein [Streptomyces sp. NPDC126499]|uniref:proprotein convertase P-domain-containing protein n=1 Tax=Streptomyces sp. NPDC126499 TaxID=3155314 RepID=UPI0033282BA4
MTMDASRENSASCADAESAAPSRRRPTRRSFRKAVLPASVDPLRTAFEERSKPDDGPVTAREPAAQARRWEPGERVPGAASGPVADGIIKGFLDGDPEPGPRLTHRRANAAGHGSDNRTVKTVPKGVVPPRNYRGETRRLLPAPAGVVQRAENIADEATTRPSSPEHRQWRLRQRPNGTWKPRVTDNVEDDTGKIDAWSLQF